jgi:hypothetical protein
MPAGTICGNKVPTCEFSPIDDPRLHLIWAGIVNSLAFDWIARRRVSTTLNFFHLMEMPFPVVRAESWLGGEIMNRVAQLTDIEGDNQDLLKWLAQACGYTRAGPDVISKDHRVKIRTELEALCKLAFDISDAEFRHICTDFVSAVRSLGGDAFIDCVCDYSNDFALRMVGQRTGEDEPVLPEQQKNAQAA